MGRIVTRRELLRAGAGAGLLLAACGRAPLGQQSSLGAAFGGGDEYDGPPVSLSYWNGFTGGDGPIMLALIDQFNKDNPNIDVTMNLVRWEDYYQKVPAAVYSGEGPDVGIMHIDILATFAAQDVILPLDDLATSLNLQADDFPAVVWDASIYRGKRFGIPLDMHPLAFYYNKDLMKAAGLDPEKPPSDRDEYMNALAAMRSEGIQGSWVSPFLFTGVFMFESLVWQFGGELFSEDGSRALFNSDAGVEALTWMVDLVKEGHSPRNVGQDADNNAFMNGDNAFIWNGPWIAGLYASNPALKWGVAPLPQIGTERAAWGNSHNFVVMNQRDVDPNKLAAAKVFISSLSRQSLTWADAGMVPARNSVRESKDYAKLVEQQVFAKEISYTHFAPSVPGIADAQEAIERVVNEAVLLRTDPRSALDDGAQIATDLLAENRRRFGG